MAKCEMVGEGWYNIPVCLNETSRKRDEIGGQEEDVLEQQGLTTVHLPRQDRRIAEARSQRLLTRSISMQFKFT